MRVGTEFNHLLVFDKGQPTSRLSFSLSNQSGDVVYSSDEEIADGQVSIVIHIPAQFNTLTDRLFEKMVLSWSYTTEARFITESLNYRLEAEIPFPVDPDSVRNMIGVSNIELPDSEIELFSAYLTFLNTLGPNVDLSEFENGGDLNSYKITKSIEAMAALAIFPTLQIRLPRSYDSGTSGYERWNNIDWQALRDSLDQNIRNGLGVVDQNLNEFVPNAVFSLSDLGADAITGA